MRRLVAALIPALGVALCGSLLVPVATASPTATPRSAYIPPPIQWQDCKSDELAGAKCGNLIVPLDWSTPEGETIKVAVARVKHTAPHYKGVMFTNPGGPGGAGRGLASIGKYLPGKAAQAYDWIGIDPRGVGASRPALSCNPKYFAFNRPAYVPSESTTEDKWIARTQRYATACRNSAAARLLPHVKTTDTVADLEALRVALGVEKVSYYGFSYGTYLGQVYATLHPDRIDKMVLDGVVDPRLDWYESNLRQNIAFEKVIGKFFAWMAKSPKLWKMGATKRQVEANYYRLLGRLKRQPIRGIGSSELRDVTLDAGYLTITWPSVATLIKQIRQGKAKNVRRAYRSAYPRTRRGDNGYAMYLATECTDAPWPRDWGTWEADNWRSHADARFLAWSNAWFNAPCRTWSAPAGTPVQVDGSAFANKFLLVSETYDAATPFAGAVAARRLFPSASLIEGVGGTSHSVSTWGSKCVTHAVLTYLRDGTVPLRKPGDQTDLKCPGLPAPKMSNLAGRTVPPDLLPRSWWGRYQATGTRS